MDFVAIDREPTAAATIRLLRPDYYVKGQEFEHRSPPPPRLQLEIEALQEVGGSCASPARPSSRPPRSWQGAAQRAATRKRTPTARRRLRRFLDGFRARHSADAVLAGLAALRKLRVLVVGEAIIDEYRYCVPLGKSPREAIVTNKQVRMERHAGGALACANHVSRFCDDVHLVTLLGAEDSQERSIRDQLRPNVVPRFFVRSGSPTITKRRYLWEPFLTELFEVAFLDDTPLPTDLEDDLLDTWTARVSRHDLVIVADYGHGFLSPRAATALAEGARFLAVNTQANAANLGFNLVTKYPRADYVCIDKAEIRLATRDRWRPVAELVDQVRKRVRQPVDLRDPRFPRRRHVRGGRHVLGGAGLLPTGRRPDGGRGRLPGGHGAQRGFRDAD